MKFFNSLKLLALLLALGTAIGFPSAASNDLQITLPDSIYTDGNSALANLDLDRDGLKDDHENRLADAWRPYFIFDEHENDRFSHRCRFCFKIDDDSLRDNEPVAIFQVYPKPAENYYRRLGIKWVFLWRLDGGYRSDNLAGTWHYGDSQSGHYELISSDGKTWTLNSLNLWIGGYRNADSSDISWTKPRSTWGQMPDRPSPKVFASAGKHHQYISHSDCEKHGGIREWEEDCSGGAERLVDLRPNGRFNNVGERKHHPSDKGINNPFVTDLAPLGFPDEYTWNSAWICRCGDRKKECFTGGLGKKWKADNFTDKSCAIPTAIYHILEDHDLYVNYKPSTADQERASKNTKSRNDPSKPQGWELWWISIFL